MSDIERIREWRDGSVLPAMSLELVADKDRAVVQAQQWRWNDVDVLLREVERLRERIGEKDRERREAEERALDAERRLTGARAKLGELEAVVRELAAWDPLEDVGVDVTDEGATP